jgi:Zn-dependent protease
VKIFRIPIKVEPYFFLIVIFLGLGRARSLSLMIEWVAVVCFSIVLHELGHALVGRAFGLEPQIRLYQMGGLTSWKTGKDLSAARQVAISLAGPGIGLLFGLVVLLLGQTVLAYQSEFALLIYSDLLWVNIGWGLCNLLPILPMDGGQVMATLETSLRKANDRVVSHTFSLLAALLIGIAAFNWHALWIGFLGFYFAYLNGSVLWTQLQNYRDRKLRQTLLQARAAIDRNEHEAAMEMLAHVSDRAHSTELKQQALHMTIVIHLRREELDLAEAELHRYSVLFGGDYYLEAALHFLKGEFAAALPNLKTIFASQPEKEIGVMLCKTLAGLGEFPEALALCSHPALAEVRWGLTVEIQTEAFNRGDFKSAAAAGIAAYDQKADANTAYNVACAFARDLNHGEALVWIRKAIESGFNDLESLRADPDLDAIRSLPEFAAILRRFEASQP